MRTVQWLFTVSVLLFLSGIAFIIAAERERRAAPSATAAAAVEVKPVATVKHLMRGIVSPASTVIFDSVSTTVSKAGVETKQPQTEEEWAALAGTAASLSEAGNLLMTGNRAVDRDDWVKKSQAMVDAGIETLKAAEAKNPDGILAAGEHVNASCDSCHMKYWRQ
ncbi:MAG TPA: hypothetical protein VGQ37_11965 [Vicinamibacterales bacterium]|jgi:hypothetical protein|nr:hypothetical protein [Vicinamibacterales bacterium]